MMNIIITVIRILPVDVEICKVFGPHLGIDFWNFKVPANARFRSISATKSPIQSRCNGAKTDLCKRCR